MIDPESTTVDWQQHAGDVCILPVGATEQHGDHLPLATDTIQAGYFGRMLAEALDVALLPVLPYGTSLEHTGFRGSFSLQPETLMQVVRDIAAEAVRQGFRIMVIVNGHGGNHALEPVARALNRERSGIRALLVRPWMVVSSLAFNESRDRGQEFHAGESETSRLMARRPDLVGGSGIDMPATGGEHPLRQDDLTLFGIGHFNPAGPVGWPSCASREKGEALLNAVRERFPAHVRELIGEARAEERARESAPG